MSKGASTVLQTVMQSSEIRKRTILAVYGLTETFYLVANDNADLTYNGNVYLSADITIGDVKTSASGDKEQVSLKLSNKWLSWAAYVASNIKNLKGQTIVIQEVYIDYPAESPVWMFEGVINSPHMTVSEFSCTIQRDTVDFSQYGPIWDYGPTCQYVYKDSQCQCTSSLATCDYTVANCTARGNITRFQGHPSIAMDMVIREQ